MILHISSFFHALYSNNLSRCLAVSMENGTGSYKWTQLSRGMVGNSLQSHCEYLKFANPLEDLHGRPNWEEEGAMERQE